MSATIGNSEIKFCCEENWDFAPYGSKHAWVELNNIPDHCARCGKKYEDYSKQMINKMIEDNDKEVEEMRKAEEEADRVEQELAASLDKAKKQSEDKLAKITQETQNS